MAQVLVRELDDEVVRRLKRRAKQHGRSLQAELRLILENAARVDISEARRVAERIRRRLAGRNHSDSGAILANDRAR